MEDHYLNQHIKTLPVNRLREICRKELIANKDLINTNMIDDLEEIQSKNKKRKKTKIGKSKKRFK